MIATFGNKTVTKPPHKIKTMARLSIGIDKRAKPYLVTFTVRSGNTKKRINAGIRLLDSDLTSNGKRVKNIVKAQLIESKRRELQDKLDSLMLETIGQHMDAGEIVERITAVASSELDFFKFADEWLKHTTIKGKANYTCMLNSLESHLGKRKLPFTAITYKMLKQYEEFLSSKPRAQSLYLGQIRHLYREAVRTYNTDYEQVIKNDPFLRYRVPRQVLKKGVRALSQEQLIKIYEFKGRPHGRAQLARDCFILSFALMGMNSVDMYNATTCKNGVICYNRTKTKDRRSDNAYIEVRIQPCIAELYKLYAWKARVFNFYRRYSCAYDFNAALNKGLKEVGKSVGIEGLNFYQARHTFATLSRNLMRFSKSDVDEALNHVGGMDLADVYIKRDFSIINDNNSKLLKKVFGC